MARAKPGNYLSAAMGAMSLSNDSSSQPGVAQLNQASGSSDPNNNPNAASPMGGNQKASNRSNAAALAAASVAADDAAAAGGGHARGRRGGGGGRGGGRGRGGARSGGGGGSVGRHSPFLCPFLHAIADACFGGDRSTGSDGFAYHDLRSTAIAGGYLWDELVGFLLELNY